MIGAKARITKDIQYAEGMLYKNSDVKVIDIQCKCTHGEKNVKIKDKAGRLFWVGNGDILIS